MARSFVLLIPAVLLGAAALPLDSTPPDPPVATERKLELSLGRPARGLSGALRTTVALPGAPLNLSLEERSGQPLAGVRYRWLPVLGTMTAQDDASLGGTLQSGGGEVVAAAPLRPGIYALRVGEGETAALLEGWRLAVQMPRDRKRRGRLNGYFIGQYPRDTRDAYAPPAGFIEVTPANQDLQLSENFKVRQFLTKDQGSTWPKYVAVDPRLIDKLELVMQELNAMGVPAERIAVMSGFRTPQYNRQGVGAGRASLSRHQYGDAADVWVDNDDDGYMDDLNGDGRRDLADARVMLRAVERVEARHPELVGGAGLYRANNVRGPFIHIDVRGRAARW